MSSNLSNETNLTILCQNLCNLYQEKYVLIPNGLGLVFNVACAFIWSNGQIQASAKTNFMFKYFQFKSIFDIIFSLSNIITSMTSRLLIGLIMDNYVPLVVQFCSTYCAIWANLVCYITLSNRFRFILKINWKIVIGSCVTFSGIFYVFRIERRAAQTSYILLYEFSSLVYARLFKRSFAPVDRRGHVCGD